MCREIRIKPNHVIDSLIYSSVVRLFVCSSSCATNLFSRVKTELCVSLGSHDTRPPAQPHGSIPRSSAIPRQHTNAHHTCQVGSAAYWASAKPPRFARGCHVSTELSMFIPRVDEFSDLDLPWKLDDALRLKKNDAERCDACVMCGLALSLDACLTSGRMFKHVNHSLQHLLTQLLLPFSDQCPMTSPQLLCCSVTLPSVSCMPTIFGTNVRPAKLQSIASDDNFESVKIYSKVGVLGDVVLNLLFMAFLFSCVTFTRSEAGR